MPRRIRSAELNGNIYITSSNGIMKLENSSSSLEISGVPIPIEPTLKLTANVNGIPFTQYDSYAYRVTFGIIDTNNNFIESAPSQRVIIEDLGATASYQVDITVKFVQNLTTNHFYRIYRSLVSHGTIAGYVDPKDELMLVYQDNIKAADLAAGFKLISDLRPDSLLNGGFLYTNATQEGIQNANLQPPYARDLAVFKNCLFASNIINKQRRIITLIGTTGIVGGTITIGGVLYTAAATASTDITDPAPAGEVPATGTFVVYTAITSPALRIEGTARSICRVINSYSVNNQYYAYYVSEPTGNPGSILIEERSIGGASYAFTAGSTPISIVFEPVLPLTGTSISTSNDLAKNGLFISKQNQPESFPGINLRYVGDKNEEIVRILPLRDSLIIIKERSIYRLTGTSLFDFTVSIIDNTVAVETYYDSAAILNNRVYSLSNQGVVAISDTGVELISRPEEFNILVGVFNKPTSFPIGIGINSQRAYFLCTFDPQMNQEELDTPGTHPYPYSTYVFNYITNSWSRWLINANCFAELNDKMFYGLNNTKGYVLEQRDIIYSKNTLFADELASVNITSINTATNQATLTYTSSVDYDGYYTQYGYTDGFGYGWIIVDGNNRYIVTNFSAGIATLNTTTALTTGIKSCYRPIPVSVEWSPEIVGDPSLLKQYSEAVLMGEISNSYEWKFQWTNQNDYKKYRFYYDYNSNPPVTTHQTNDLIGFNSTKSITYSHIRPWVDKTRESGTCLNVRVTNNIADSAVFIKGMAIKTRPTATNKLK